MLVCHDGPNATGRNQAGWPIVRQALESAPATLVIRGHDGWEPRLGTLDNGTQVLNVEGCVAVLRRRR